MTLAHRLFAGTAQLTLSNGAVRLLAIFTMPVLTALLDPQAYGVASLAGTVIALAAMVALAGIDMSYARAFHSAQPPTGTVVERFSWRFALGMAVLIASITGIGWRLLAPGDLGGELQGWLPWIVASGIVLSVAHTMAQTRAQLGARYRAMSLAIGAAGVLSVTCSILIARYWRQDAAGLLLAMLLSYLVPVALLGMPHPRTLLRRSSVRRDEGSALLRIGLAGVVTAPLYWLLSSSDRWFLQHFAGLEAVGIYSIGYSVAIVGMMINNAVIAVWVPEASREYERDPMQARETLGAVMSRLIAVMALVWLAVAAGGGDIVQLLANERFHAAREVVPFIAGGVFFYGVLHLGNGGLLLARKLELAIAWWLAGGAVCAVLNLKLIPVLGSVGAAMAQTASFALIGLGIFGTAWRTMRFSLAGWRLAAVLALVLVLGIAMAPPWHASPLSSLALKLPIGMAVTAITLWFMAPAWFAARVDHLRRMALP